GAPPSMGAVWQGDLVHLAPDAPRTVGSVALRRSSTAGGAMSCSGAMARRAAACGLVACCVILVGGLASGGTAPRASAPTSGTLHVVYKAEATTDKQSGANEETTNGHETVNWNVAADIPLKSASNVTSRFSTNGSGPVTANGTYKVVVP